MRTYSKILNKWYDADDGNVVYVTNMLQAQRYLKNDDSWWNAVYSPKKL